MSYIGNLPTTAAFPFDQFSGTGSQTAFTLTYAPAGPTSILVVISGVTQNPNSYSVIGQTLAFSPAPPTGTNNIAVLYLGLPVIGTTSPGNTAFFSPTPITATAGQTVFTPSSAYTSGFVRVIRNGSTLAPADYTATNGTTVTLLNPCTAGDIVVIETYVLSSLVNALPQTGGTITGNLLVNGDTSVGGNFTLTGNASGIIKSGTAVTASGTSIDFTGIPATAKRVTVEFVGVSNAGASSSMLIQLGTSSGVVASGYLGASSLIAATVTTQNFTTGFGSRSQDAAAILHGAVVINNVAGNTWNAFGVLANSNTATSVTTAGSTTLAGVLDRVRVTSLNGTDVFDAGTINILWE